MHAAISLYFVLRGFDRIPAVLISLEPVNRFRFVECWISDLVAASS